jgi:hypothetical protein
MIAPPGSIFVLAKSLFLHRNDEDRMRAVWIDFHKRFSVVAPGAERISGSSAALEDFESRVVFDGEVRPTALQRCEANFGITAREA